MDFKMLYLSGPVAAIAVVVAVIFIVLYVVSMNKAKKEIESREKEIESILKQLPTVDKIDIPEVDSKVDSNAQLKSFVVAKAAEKSPELAQVIKDSDVKTVPVVKVGNPMNNKIPSISGVSIPTKIDFLSNY